jgi:phenylpyruvate tautomerase PptA (4-oxalocrotonate tautomerase family)
MTGRRLELVFCLENATTTDKLGKKMRVECAGCTKVYNFKDERLPPHAFTFPCKQCGQRITISQTQLDAIKTGAKKKKEANKDTAKKKAKVSLLKIQLEKLKKLFVKVSSFLADLTGRSEREWIFTLTKFVTYFSIGLLVVLIILGGVTYFSINSKKTVSYADVKRSLELKDDPVITIQAVVPDIKIPREVKKYLGDDNKGTFVEWMNGLDENQKKDFIENLSQIIQQAQKDEPENIYAFINEYTSLKFKWSVDKPLAKYLFKFGLIIAMITMVGLLGLFSLVLLQLASQKTPSR